MENAQMQWKKNVPAAGQQPHSSEGSREGSREFQAGETRSRRKRRAQCHVGGVRERGLVGGREEWEEFTARSCVRGGAQGEGGKERGDAADR